jgi:phosphopantothenoylcysteine decarboxylase/phosphopantothenate--cysteine ligase
MPGLLHQKKILLGICGSIAAYKSVYLCRNLMKEGAEVRVVLTPYAKDFVSALTFSTISKNTVYHELIDADQWNNHVELGLWADLMIIAPATASTLSKMASGNVDNMLLAVYLSAKCPVYVAPAMDLDMWKHPSTQHNIKTLKTYGNTIIPVGVGELASGLSGEGRMAEPEEIVKYIIDSGPFQGALSGKKVMITAGPTYENIDPVRFIGNASSGKMGIALAEVCYSLGAEVTLVLGPSSLRPKTDKIRISHVTSSDQMYESCRNIFAGQDIVIFAAAVADYKPKFISEEKIKKKDESLVFELIKTVDIASTLGKMKTAKQFTIGFALETHDEVVNAKSKLEKKNFDMIVLNSLKDEGAGFQVDTNKISVIDRKGDVISFPLKTKTEVAADIMNIVVQKLSEP